MQVDKGADVHFESGPGYTPEVDFMCFPYQEFTTAEETDSRDQVFQNSWNRYPGESPDCSSALEATQGQNDGFFSQLPYKCYLEEVASVGD